MDVRKTERINFRITPETKEKLRRASQASGFSQSAYLCRLIESQGGGRSAGNGELLAELKKVQTQLETISGTLRELADSGSLEELQETIQQLDDLRAALYHKYFTDWGYRE